MLRRGKTVNSYNSKGKLIESFYSALAGVTFENRQSLLKNLYVGQQLVLKRMPDNPYDSNAIAVFDPNTMQQVGFIRKHVAASTAPIMDRSDRYVSCTVEEITGGGDRYLGVNILIEIFEKSADSAIDVAVISANDTSDVIKDNNYTDVFKAINYFDTGTRYLEGIGFSKDTKKAFYWIHESAKCGYPVAQSLLGKMYATGIGVLRDARKAFYWINKAAEQGNAEAQYLLGLMYSDGSGVIQNEHKAFEWLLKSAMNNYDKAQFMVGLRYITKVGTEKDLKKASEWLKKAALQGNEEAQFNLGVMYERGEYFAKNEEIAKSWYEKAANQGYKDAEERLRILKEH